MSSLVQPERVMSTRCNVMIDGNPMSYPCTRAQGHEAWGEPHYAVEIARTVRAWEAWYAQQQEKAVEPPAHPVAAEAPSPVERLGSFHEAARQPQQGGGLFDENAIRARRGNPEFANCSEACLLQGHTEEEGCALHRPVTAIEVPGIRVEYGEPTKQRDGDQVLPTGDETQRDIQSLVIEDVLQRRQVGIERYGQGLRPFNGRDTLLDTYEEALDLTTYLRSLLEMQRADRERLEGVILAEVVEVLMLLFGETTARQAGIALAGRITDRIVDSFAFPGKAPDHVVKALGVATTPTRMPTEKRIEAAEVVRAWLLDR